jgi:hypothetical protein
VSRDDLITIEEAEPDAPVSCGCCEWRGAAAQLDEPDGAILTPGDPSPAGRCPECGSLVYLEEEDPPAPSVEAQLVAALQHAQACAKTALLHQQSLSKEGLLELAQEAADACAAALRLVAPASSGDQAAPDHEVRRVIFAP